ncbi:MAG: hypothetical protein ACPHO8_11335, partial [Mariniblastus sp.]
ESKSLRSIGSWSLFVLRSVLVFILVTPCESLFLLKAVYCEPSAKAGLISGIEPQTSGKTVLAGQRKKIRLESIQGG